MLLYCVLCRTVYYLGFIIINDSYELEFYNGTLVRSRGRNLMLTISQFCPEDGSGKSLRILEPVY
jgi:hypothetical protein